MKKDRSKKLENLLFVSTMINSSLDPADVQEQTIRMISKLLDSEAGSFLLIDEDTGELTFEVATGEKGEQLKTIRLKRGEGVAGWVAHHDVALVVDDVRSDDRFSMAIDRETGFRTKSIICVPVRSKGKIIGVLEGINKKEGRFNDNDLFLMKILADQVGIAYLNAKLYSDLKETFYSTVEALADIIELRDPLTGGHTKRVMNISLIIGKYRGLGKGELEDLKLAAILHDIGKVGIRDDVLLKKGALDTDELGLIHRHPHHGIFILEHIKRLKNVIPGVRSHHERYDGSGYPEGLKGDEIPLIARIIAVADTFDAMTTDRPYRETYTCGDAIEELKKNAGTQFDPSVIDALVISWEKERSSFEDKSFRSIRI